MEGEGKINGFPESYPENDYQRYIMFNWDTDKRSRIQSKKYA